jgi:hypothetical protein
VLPSIETAKKEKTENERKREREERHTSRGINIWDSVSIMDGMPCVFFNIFNAMF